MKAIVFLGPPGSGKGTQVRLLSEALGLPYIGMGDLLRAESEKNTPRGARVRAYVQSGDILPWAIAESIFRDHLEEISAPWVILDGMPRNLDQVVHLESLLKSRGGQVSRVVFLDVGDDELMRRIQSRFQCAQCGMSCTQVGQTPLSACRLCKGTSFLRRSDDQAGDVLVHRLEVYHQMTRPVMDYYRDRGLLFLLDGTQPIDILQEQLITMVRAEMAQVKHPPSQGHVHDADKNLGQERGQHQDQGHTQSAQPHSSHQSLAQASPERFGA